MTTTGPQPLTPADRQFVFGHARNYARPDIDLARAEAYAQWYTAGFCGPDTTMNDLPAHPHVWGRFLDGYTPPPDDDA